VVWFVSAALADAIVEVVGSPLDLAAVMSMSDTRSKSSAGIVERLRGTQRRCQKLGHDDVAFMVGEAADEIKRLQAALALAEKALTLRGPGWPLDEVRRALEGK
jgi:hypothetical protein